MVFAFGDFELDTVRFELRRRGDVCPVEPQVFDVLHYLVVHRDRVVSKNELLDSVWGDRFVSESALTSRIKAARRALGDDGRSQHVIRTSHGRGYRFIAQVEEPRAGATDPHGQPASDAGAATRSGGEPWPLIGRGAEIEMIGEWLRDPACGGVMLVGEAGMGKTRLADELVALAASTGVPTARAVGHEEARSIPLGAFAHLVPVDAIEPSGNADLDRATLFHRARAALGDSSPRRLLSVDDVQHLDELSRSLLASLVEARAVFAILTMRTPAAPLATIDDLVRNGHLVRVELGPLSLDQVKTLLHRALEGPMVAESARQFCDASLGNPGIVRHLVETVRDTGALAATHGVWALNGPLATTPTLEALVAGRLSDLDEQLARAVELPAIAGELGVEVLARLVGDDTVDELERRGLLGVRTVGKRHDARLAHPLYGEVVRSGLPTIRARRVRRELAEALEAVGARRRDDRIRVVAWRMEGGGHVDAGLLVHAARLAVIERDDEVARKLLDRALADEPSQEAYLVLAELEFRQGRMEQVAELLRAVDLDTLDDVTRAGVVRRRAIAGFFGTMRYEEACAMLDDELARSTDPAARARLEAQLAAFLSNGGQVRAALQRAESALPNARGGARLELLRTAALSLVHAARPLAGLELAIEGSRLRDELGDDPTLPGRTMLLFTQVVAHAAAGQVDAARATAEQLRREHPDLRTNWLDTAVGRLELMAGRPDAARRALAPVVHDARLRGHDAVERWVLALHASAHLLDGNTAAAERELERVAALEHGERGLYHAEIDRAHASCAATLGDRERARELLWFSIDDCRARGHVGMESAMLHDLLRFGTDDRSGKIADRLADIAAASDGTLFVARGLYATGMRDGSVDDLARAVDLFAQGGATVYAAEASSALAGAFDRLGRPAERDAVMCRAEELRCAGGVRVVTPALDA